MSSKNPQGSPKKSIFNDDETNKSFLAGAANILIIISILGCILAILDYHLDLHDSSVVTQSYGFGMFLLIFNWGVVIGNTSYIALAVYRYFEFTKQKNKAVVSQILSFRESTQD